MLEIPEANTIARQLKETVCGKRIVRAVAAASPHGFAWYTGDPALYGPMLDGLLINDVVAYGGRPEMHIENLVLSFNDGVNMRYYAPEEAHPDKHQLLLELGDGSALVCTVQMYGGLMCFPGGANDEEFYYKVAKEKPSPLSEAFDQNYFTSLLTDATRKLSAKAFLATEQRIPGLGNGVLQDILWQAKIHPKRKINTLRDGDLDTLFQTVKKLLREMTEKGGRDTEKDLFGHPGGYATVMSKKSSEALCPACGAPIKRMAYLGGNVYVCERCQGTGK